MKIFQTFGLSLEDIRTCPGSQFSSWLKLNNSEIQSIMCLVQSECPVDGEIEDRGGEEGGKSKYNFPAQ